VAQADEIYVIDRGRIVERGRLGEVLAHGRTNSHIAQTNSRATRREGLSVDSSGEPESQCRTETGEKSLLLVRRAQLKTRRLTEEHRMKVLVLGAGGMLGSACYEVFADSDNFRTYGTLRDVGRVGASHQGRGTLIPCVNALDLNQLAYIFDQCGPEVVINCIGIIKQLESVKNLPLLIETNALLPHRLADLCSRYNARLVHISTDCVFSGAKGMYKESDAPDAVDAYGRTKQLGETEALNAVTLRTSIIGHEVKRNVSLIDWFLAQRGTVKGYRQAVFSGLPSVELARVIRDYVVPDREMTGLYHVAAAPIAKFDLLRLVAEEYGSKVDLAPDDALVIDRSLNGQRFRDRTGYVAAPWPTLIQTMHERSVRSQAIAA
jgi:dTDP-4-dehydrorhamnose reductase